MTDDEFWQTIDDSQPDGGFDPDRQCELLRQRLEQLTNEELIAFNLELDRKMNDAYRWDLWAAAYILQGGCGDDSFIDFRSVLILRGRNFFESTLTDPDQLAVLELRDPYMELFYEGLLYVPRQVYEDRTGEYPPSSGEPQPQDPAGEPWEESAEDLAALMPRLWDKYGWEESA